MPNTGNQALVFRGVPSDGPIEPWDLGQVIATLNGNFGAPIFLTALNRSDFFSLLIKNLDPTNSRGLQVQDDTGFALLNVEKVQTVIKPVLIVRESLAVSSFDNSFTALLSNMTNTVIKPVLLVRDELYVTSDDGSQTYFQATAAGAEIINSNSSGFLLLIKNLDSANSRGVQVLDDTGFALLTVQKSGTVIKPLLTVRDTFKVTSLDGATTYFQADSTGATVLGSPLSRSVIGSYTGNGGTTQRTISVGFVPNWVTLVGGNSDATIEQYTIHSSNGSSKSDNTGNLRWSAAVKLSGAGNEFYVANGNTDGNVSGRNYSWIAYR